MYVTFPCKHDTHFDFAPMCRVSCFINVICSYLHIAVSNTISMSYDIRVNQQQHDVHHRCLLRFMLLNLYFSVYYCVNHCLSFFCFGDYVVHFSSICASDYPCVSLNFSSLITYKVLVFSHEHYIIILSRNESGRFGALKSDSTHHFFRNVCTKSGSLRSSQFSGCWLIVSVYILMSFDFPFLRLFGVR